jgi:hypothetical protein
VESTLEKQAGRGEITGFQMLAALMNRDVLEAAPPPPA